MVDILISEFMDDAAVAGLVRDFDVLYDPELVNDPEKLACLMAGVPAIIVRNQTMVNDALLDAATDLKVVGRLGVGLDNIDMDVCKNRDITVYPALGANTVSVAELVMGAMFMMFRGAYQSTQETASGGWPRMKLLGREMMGKQLGLVGFGTIGRAVGMRARAMGMSVLAYDPALNNNDPLWQEQQTTPVSLDELIETSDAISLHVPLSKHTKNLFSRPQLAAMKSDAYLINTARGGVVDEQALANALKSNEIGGAFLDVYETEPLPVGNVLDDVPNLYLTPHVGARTIEADIRVSNMIADAVRNFFKTLEFEILKK